MRPLKRAPVPALSNQCSAIMISRVDLLRATKRSRPGRFLENTGRQFKPPSGQPTVAKEVIGRRIGRYRSLNPSSLALGSLIAFQFSYAAAKAAAQSSETSDCQNNMQSRYFSATSASDISPILQLELSDRLSESKTPTKSGSFASF